MSLHFKATITKKAFEQKLAVDLGIDGLAQCPYDEEGQKLTLYYKHDVHVGTWSNGVGWIFKSAYEKKAVIV